jgi:hypothetical protein
MYVRGFLCYVILCITVDRRLAMDGYPRPASSIGCPIVCVTINSESEEAKGCNP